MDQEEVKSEPMDQSGTGSPPPPGGTSGANAQWVSFEFGGTFSKSNAPLKGTLHLEET